LREVLEATRHIEDEGSRSKALVVATPQMGVYLRLSAKGPIGCKAMAGLLQTKDVTHRREQIIEKWMLAIIEDGGIDRYDSLHVDRIDDSWKSRDLWIKAGAEAFSLGSRVRDRHGLRFPLVLAFSLIAAAEPLGVDFKTQDELERNLNWMPPALYLFRPGEEFWSAPLSKACANDITVQKLTAAVLMSSPEFQACYYMEFKQADSEEYSRSIFFEG
jgi:hypothetical protein